MNSAITIRRTADDPTRWSVLIALDSKNMSFAQFQNGHPVFLRFKNLTTLGDFLIGTGGIDRTLL